jgi:hypothetical protein
MDEILRDPGVTVEIPEDPNGDSDELYRKLFVRNSVSLEMRALKVIHCILAHLLEIIDAHHLQAMNISREYVGLIHQIVQEAG